MSDLRTIPGVGKKIEQRFLDIGISGVSQLKGKSPEDLYQQNCVFQGIQEDRCLLYVFRLAVYFAEHEVREAEKLNWWYWKDHNDPHG